MWEQVNEWTGQQKAESAKAEGKEFVL